MLNVLSCIVVEHDLRYVALAAIVCIFGSFLSMRIYTRMRRSEGSRRWLWLFLGALVASCTIWTTHFAAMLGYLVPFERSFAPGMTIASFVILFVCTCFAFSVSLRSASGPYIELGGALFGLGISVMHYTGMAAFLVPGIIEWDPVSVLASILLGAVLGLIAFNRASRPVTRFCRSGSALAMILAIVSMHFTGMESMTIIPVQGMDIPLQSIPDEYMLAAVIGVTTLLLVTVGSSYTIDLFSVQEATERYEQLALFDPLTGLPNKAWAEAKLADLLASATRSNDKVAIYAVDLEQFGTINAAHGDAAGDEVLREVGLHLHDSTAADEYAVRLPGAQFALIKAGVYGRHETSTAAVRLQKLIAGPHNTSAGTLMLRSAIGYAVFPDDGLDASALLTRASLAAQEAKRGGSGEIRRYQAGLDDDVRHQARIAIDLRNAVSGNQLELYYQPQNCTSTRSLVGFEALVRWHHPVLGMVPPGEFIPVAERTGLIAEIGEYVLHRACADAAAWPAPYKVAVNVAAYQLTRIDLPARVEEVLKETGLAPERLEIELTESGLIADHTRALATISRLKALGVSIAMDDFGTGYSSLALLQHFPFDKIKIDRSFISDVANRPRAAAIVRAALLIAESMNIPVLAEGVESEEEFSYLRDAGCPAVQGFLFGRPMPLSSAQTLMLREQLRVAPAVDAVSSAANAVLQAPAGRMAG